MDEKHSHSTWNWDMPVDDELIDDIIGIMRSNNWKPPIGFTPKLSHVDNIAYMILDTMNTGIGVELTIAATPYKYQDKAREIVDRVITIYSKIHGIKE